MNSRNNLYKRKTSNLETLCSYIGKRCCRSSFSSLPFKQLHCQSIFSVAFDRSHIAYNWFFLAIILPLTYIEGIMLPTNSISWRFLVCRGYKTRALALGRGRQITLPGRIKSGACDRTPSDADIFGWPTSFYLSIKAIIIDDTRNSGDENGVTDTVPVILSHATSLMVSSNPATQEVYRSTMEATKCCWIRRLWIIRRGRLNRYQFTWNFLSLPQQVFLLNYKSAR